MNFIVITGPPAVGKMTVGQALAKKTGYKLLYNHLTIDAVNAIFDFNEPPFWPLVHEFRRMLVREAAKHNVDGLIFTFCWAFDLPGDRDQMEQLAEIVKSANGTVHYVELRAELDERLERNRSVNRLHHKPIKRDIENSEKYLMLAEEIHEFRTSDKYPPPYPDDWLTIDNTHLNADHVADQIAAHFTLPNISEE